jgi:hypothetical protein
VDLIFADAHDHTHYNRTYFAGLIFMVSQLFMNTTKIDPMKPPTMLCSNQAPLESMTNSPFLTHHPSLKESVITALMNLELNANMKVRLHLK